MSNKDAEFANAILDKALEIKQTDLKVYTRRGAIMKFKWVVAIVLNRFGISKSEIGRVLARGRERIYDHTTVINWLSEGGNMWEVNYDFRSEYGEMMKELISYGKSIRKEKSQEEIRGAIQDFKLLIEQHREMLRRQEELVKQLIEMIN